MNKLKDLDIFEVSVVDAGSNPAADIVLYKRKGDKDNMDELKKEDVSKAKADLEAATAMFKNLSDRMAAHVEKAERAEYLKIAKKYEILGEKAEDLSKTLKQLSSQPEMYNSAIKMLDNALDAVQKAGTFAEIGKSGYGTLSDKRSQIEKIAAEIQAKEPELSWRFALDKAYQAHPELRGV